MNCPVCQHINVPSLATTCPNCSASLVGIKLINALEDQYVETVKAKVALEGEQIQSKKVYEATLRKKNRRINGLLFLLFLLPLTYYFFGQPQPKVITTPNLALRDSLDQIIVELAETEKELALKNQKLTIIKKTQNIRELEYVVQEGDVLYDLGVLFYNDTTAWYQIALDNKIYDIKGLPIGDTLKIIYRDLLNEN